MSPATHNKPSHKGGSMGEVLAPARPVRGSLQGWGSWLLSLVVLVGMLGVSTWLLTEAAAQSPPATPQVAAQDPLTLLVVQLLGAGGMPAVVVGVVAYLLRQGGPTLTIRLGDDDRALLQRAADSQVGQAVLEERTRNERREIRKVRETIHWHANVLQILAGHANVEIPARPVFRDDEDSDDPGIKSSSL